MDSLFLRFFLQQWQLLQEQLIRGVLINKNIQNKTIIILTAFFLIILLVNILTNNGLGKGLNFIVVLGLIPLLCTIFINMYKKNKK
ncbi:hypothetical protein CCAND95_120024 [Capnocytophaga canis]|uniref:Uncharacterized protein n=1 Tax=Capnocytophaga canis TaxID=1848903 RepID=A0A3A1YFZ3_9FLAO|nr:hypothetical protein CKY20_07750 [Capnocytophaga canis]CEN42627.1 hypothetical protein CCAND95_120024 [Capnocytophaga canis]